MRLLCLLVLTLLPPATLRADEARPNILWIVAEDTSPWMGCYGHEINKGHTPNFDSIAERGVRFTRAYTPAPVCSACRSALMLGQNQIRSGVHEHRSSRGPAKIYVPEGMRTLPELMRDAGYATFNIGKDDYNFIYDRADLYTLSPNPRMKQIPWEAAKANQPFFGQIQTKGGKHNTANFPAERKVDPQTVTVPADYPQTDLYHEVVAQHYDAIRKDDDDIGHILEGLKNAGLADNTVVIYFSDHGANNLVRHKQMPTEGGLHVPLMMLGPEKWIPAGEVRNDLVNLLDVCATTLSLAGVPKPKWYEGNDLFGKFKPRDAVFAAKDRLDHTIDRVRSVRTERFRYTRNFKLDRILLQPQYRDGRPFVVQLRELYKSGKLESHLKRIYFGERPAEELYDVVADPAQVNNLADDPQYADELQAHRDRLRDWIARGDAGAGEEPDAELEYQASGQKWGEGVNPEYEHLRKDSDGDGLSDEWERITGRDPNDGKLLFTFDCGGWQTEGFEPAGFDDNLAGFLGELEFTIPKGKSSIRRSGLKLTNVPSDAFLSLSMQPLTGVDVDPRLNRDESGTLTGIEIVFEADEPTKLVIDTIELARPKQ